MKNYHDVQQKITIENLKEREKQEIIDVHLGRIQEAINFFIGEVGIFVNVLEIGSSNGLFLEALKARGYLNVIGVDNIDEAVTASLRRGNKCYYADAHNLPYKDESFGLVILSHVLEHCYDPYKTLKEAVRVVQNKGYVFIEIPLEPKPDVTPTKWGHYYTFQSPSDLLELFKTSECKSVKIIKEELDEKKNKWFRLLLRKKHTYEVL